MGWIRTALAGLVVLSAGTGACGHDSGPGPYGAIGAPCRADFDCGGLFCVDVSGGTCQLSCRDDVDCGPGYRCRGRSRRGAGGNVEVCVPG